MGIILFVFLVSGFCGLHELHIYTPDSGRYLFWANSLARGEGYRDTSTPEPTRYVVHSPLYALFLAPSQWLFPNSTEAAKATTLLFGAFAIVLLFLFFREVFEERIALLGTLFFVFYPETLNYSTQVLTEIPFVCATLSLFLLIKKYVVAEKPSFLLTVALVINIAVVLLLREVGVVLAFSVVLYFYVLKRKKEAFIFLLILATVYGGWMVRNELIVAPQENPITQNSRIFTMHMYTEATAPMTEEYLTRLKTNAGIYWNIFSRLLFIAGFYFPLRREIFVSSFPIQWIDANVSVLQGVGFVASLLLLGVGIYAAVKDRYRLNFLFTSYTVFNLSVLLIYPITDIRFLYPLFPIFLFYMVYGLRALLKNSVRLWKHLPKAALVFFALLSVPNILWSAIYQLENVSYARDPLAHGYLFECGQEYFSRALKPVGEWLCARTSPDEVVVTKWNELALFLQGRKVALTNPRTTIGDFENLVRDYQCRYLVCALQPDSSNEYQPVFAQSRRYAFIPVYQQGSVEIREIVPKRMLRQKENEIPATSNYEREYREAYATIETDPLKSFNAFFLMGLKYRNIDCMYNMAVAYEFLDSLDWAERYFKKFLYLQQGGAFLRNVNVHLTVLSHLRNAASDTVKMMRASYYHAAAMGLWYLGYQQRALYLLKKAIAEDSTFFPACITTAIFALHVGDTATSRRYLAVARKYEPYNTLSKNLSRIHAYFDTLKHTSKAHRRIALRRSIAEAYHTMGFYNVALDELFDILIDAPDDAPTLELLAQYLEEKKCIYSARKMYAKLKAMYPENSFYQMKYALHTKVIE